MTDRAYTPARPLPLVPTLERAVRNYAVRDQVGPVMFDLIRHYGSREKAIEALDAQPQATELEQAMGRQITNGNKEAARQAKKHCEAIEEYTGTLEQFRNGERSR